jgi:imidazolonepropionase-like amidohydrolase
MGRLVLRDANVWDAAEGSRRATVVVDGERIAHVGPAVDAAPDDRVVDLGGRTVMPGMVTTHFHSSYHELGAKQGPFGLEEPVALQAVRAVNNYGTAVRAGFTSTVSAGAPHGIDAAMKMAVREGALVGPRIVAGSHDISSTGHANDASFPWYWDVRAQGAIKCCDGADEVRKAVREEVKAGAEIIKLFVTGGHGTLRDRELIEMTPDELRAAIDTAHDRGVLIRGHIANKEALLLAVSYGIDVVDHGDGIDDECIEAMVEAGTFLVPSQLFPVKLHELMGGALGFTGDAQQEVEDSLAMLRKVQDAGIRILIGDDYGAIGFPHGRYADELPFYVDRAGMSATEVLTWATANGAALVREDLGQVAPGLLADLLVVDGDPLADVAILADADRLLAVLRGGTFVTDELDRVPAPIG